MFFEKIDFPELWKFKLIHYLELARED